MNVESIILVKAKIEDGKKFIDYLGPKYFNLMPI